MKAEKCRIAFNEDFDLDEEDKKETNEAFNDKVKTIIISTLTVRVLRNVYKDTASEMWELLCNKYEVKDAQGINFTRRKFLNCKQEGNETVENHIERVFMLRDELEAAAHLKI